jgi:hypothetical protein
MPVVATPIFPQTIKAIPQQILPATASALVTLYSGGTFGSRVDNIVVTSTDTTNRDLQFYITSGGVDYLVATMQAPQGAGNTNGVYPVSVFQSLPFAFLNFDPNGNKYLYLDSTNVLKVKSTTTVTAAKVIQFVTQGGDY